MKDLIRHFIFAASLMLLSFAACNNDGLEQSQPGDGQTSGQPQQPGEDPESKPVTFLAELVASRTSFGAGSESMYWSNGDRLVLYCPQAAGAHTEYFTLKEVPENTSSHQIVTSAMSWSGADAHDFYASHPVTKISEDLTADLYMPSIQTVSGSDDPDMSLVKMLAAATGISGMPESVDLKFQPAFSALDIRFSVTEDITISRISVSSSDGTPVAGDYKAEFDGSEWKYRQSSNQTGNSSVMALQIAGSEGISLSAGDEARFLAFLLPLQYDGLNVDLLTADGKVFNHKVEGLAPAQTRTLDLSVLPPSSSWETVYDVWMKYIPDNVYVSDLSIPGTHDAATYTLDFDMVKCQSRDFAAQLAGGVRLFDLRPDGKDLIIYHSIFSTGISLRQALGYMKDYVADNPSEGCIVFIKEENTWSGEKVSPTLAEYADNILNFSSKLTVGQLRGKILVISRTNYSGTIYGGNFSKGWPDNTSGGSIGIGYNQGESKEVFWLQDQYDSSTSKDVKAASFKAYADKARKDKAPNDWLCNHVSLAGSPKSNAQYLNPIAVEYILSNPGRTAIVMLDYACDDAIGGDALVNAIVNQNVRYKQAAK